MGKVERVGISLDKKLLAMFDRLIDKQGYPNRSEAVRDLIRERLGREQLAKPSARAIAGVFLVYDHHTTDLSRKLLDLQHGNLLKVVASLHVHLDEHNCLEAVILKGRVSEIQKVADRLTSLKGVKLGRVNTISAGRELA
jgi:CopG family nickel-responsive transcriptional regulator